MPSVAASSRLAGGDAGAQGADFGSGEQAAAWLGTLALRPTLTE